MGWRCLRQELGALQRMEGGGELFLIHLRHRRTFLQSHLFHRSTRDYELYNPSIRKMENSDFHTANEIRMPEAETWSLGTHEGEEFESHRLTNLRHRRA